MLLFVGGKNDLLRPADSMGRRIESVALEEGSPTLSCAGWLGRATIWVGTQCSSSQRRCAVNRARGL